ncbi:NIPSNAP family protein [Terricaulis sp.]|uniref:NIPSNAP family protein n=1 Tax=Terricaulis sp. TaxID=2768686 RepID=UPI003784FEBB
MPPLHVFELRNYTLRSGQRDVLIDLFEREFVESQDTLGAYVLGTFRNADDPERFVWLRGFETMETRRAALEAFYFGPVWQAHRNTANATMVDSDNVLLLRPHSGSLTRDASARPPIGAAPPESTFVATTYFLALRDEEAFASFFTRDVAPYLAETGAALVASLTTEHSANTFPQLPVRENETLFVSLARFESAEAHAAHLRALEAWSAWRRVAETIARRTRAPTETLRLQPTARSLLR